MKVLFSFFLFGASSAFAADTEDATLFGICISLHYQNPYIDQKGKGRFREFDDAVKTCADFFSSRPDLSHMRFTTKLKSKTNDIVTFKVQSSDLEAMTFSVDRKKDFTQCLSCQIGKSSVTAAEDVAKNVLQAAINPHGCKPNENSTLNGCVPKCTNEGEVQEFGLRKCRTCQELFDRHVKIHFDRKKVPSYLYPSQFKVVNGECVDNFKCKLEREIFDPVTKECKPFCKLTTKFDAAYSGCKTDVDNACAEKLDFLTNNAIFEEPDGMSKVLEKGCDIRPLLERGRASYIRSIQPGNFQCHYAPNAWSDSVFRLTWLDINKYCAEKGIEIDWSLVQPFWSYPLESSMYMM